MFIPLGNRHYCTVSGQALRQVNCVNCGGEYFYVIERKIMRETFSPLFLNEAGATERVRQAALSNLEEGLSKDCELVPCPDCGHYQPDMLRKLKGSRIIAVFVTWLVACLCVGLLYVTGSAEGNDRNEVEAFVQRHLVMLMVVALVLLAIGIWGAFQIDPNRSAARRLAREPNPDGRAIRRSELEAMIAQREGQPGSL